MARIRIYEEQVGAPRPVAGRQATAADAGGMADGWHALARAGEQIAGMMQKREDEDALTWANSEAARAKLDWMQQFQDRQNTAAPGAAGFTTSMDKDYQADLERRLAGTSNPRAQRHLRQQLESFGTSLMSQSIAWEDRARTEHRASLTVQEADTLSKIVNKDPSRYATEIESFRAGLDQRGLDPIQREKLWTNGKRAIAYSAAEHYVENDPQALVGPQALERTAKVAGKIDPLAVINRTIDVHEGTAFVPKDGNSGAPARFGINQRANPDVDVANLTRDGAVDLYRKRYWDAVGAGDLPADMAQAAFDAAVNMGVPTAKKLLAVAGGDLTKFQEARKAEYRAIVDRNPKQAPYLDTWLRRVDKVSGEIQQITPEIPQVPEDAAKEAFEPGIPGWSDLTLNDQQALREKARQAMNQRLATDRALLVQQQKDFRASALATGEGGNRPSEAAYVRQYGEQLGRREFQEDTRILETGRFVRDVRTLTPAEQESRLGPSPGPDAPEDVYRLHAMKAQALVEARKERDKDPALYAARYVPEVQTAQAAVRAAEQAYADDPNGATEQALRGATARYLQTQAEQQRRLGVAQPRLFADAELDAVAERLTAQGTQGEDIAARIQNLKNQYGSFYGDLFSSLAKKDKLTPIMLVLGTDVPPTTAARLAAADAANREQPLAKLFDPDQIKGVDERVRSEMQPFVQTIRHGVGMGAREEAAFQDQIKLLALSYMRGGESMSAAVKKANAEVLGSQYQFDGTLRLPANVDAPSVTRGLDAFKRGLTGADVWAPAGMKADAAAQSVRDFGYWVTDPDGLGATLYISGAVAPGADGKPITRKFIEAQMHVTAARSRGGEARAPLADADAGPQYKEGL